MGLFFTSTDRVDYGSATSLDNLAQMTVMAWVNFDSFPGAGGTTEMLLQKDPFNFFIYNDGAGAILNLERSRATTVLVVAALVSNFQFFRVGMPVFVAGRFDSAGANGDQQLFTGTRRHAIREPSAYTSQQVGSGALSSDAANSMSFGNEGGGTNPLNAVADLCVVSNAYLTVKEINDVREATAKGLLPTVRGAVIYSPLGLLTSTTRAYDLTSYGNNGAITGTRIDQRSGQRWTPRIVPKARGFVPAAPAAPTAHNLTLLGVG